MFGLNNSKKIAFTLIELLVVLAIIGMLATVSFIGFFSARQHRQVKVVAEQIKTRIIEAHSYAMTPPAKDSAGNDIDITGLGYIRVVIDSTTSTLKILEIKNDGTTVLGTVITDNISNTIHMDSATINFIANDKDKMGQLNNPYSPFNITSEGITYQLTVNQFSGSVDIK